MPKSISSLLIFSLMGVFALALTLVLLLSYHKFENAFHAAINDRYVFVLYDIQESLGIELSVGIPIEKLSQAQSILEKTEKIDPAILSIEVFNLKGRTLFSTDRSFVGDFIPELWGSFNHSTKSEYWTVQEREGVALGINLTNILGTPVGGVVIRYAVTEYSKVIDHFIETLIQKAFGLWIGSVALIIVFVLLFTKQLKVYIQGLSEVISSLGQDNQQEAIKEERLIEGSALHAFTNGYNEAEKHLDMLNQELHKIDEET